MLYSSCEGRPFQPFEIDPDYYLYVDGKPRYAGVDSFLRSRGIIVDIVDWEIPTIPRARKSCAGSGTVRTSCSTKF
jgi:alpha,alpha-trehalase